tara:strand:- start:16133 stop:16354 length:222 start_codon:yes stop_codon:yes gene_type:complete
MGWILLKKWLHAHQQPEQGGQTQAAQPMGAPTSSRVAGSMIMPPFLALPHQASSLPSAMAQLARVRFAVYRQA